MRLVGYRHNGWLNQRRERGKKGQGGGGVAIAQQPGVLCPDKKYEAIMCIHEDAVYSPYRLQINK